MSERKLIREQEMIAGLKGDNHKAFEDLFNYYYGRLCNYAMILLKSKELSEEIVQETLIKIWENRATLEINSSLNAYIYKSVYNHCLMFIKRQDVLRRRYNRMAEEIIYHYDLAVKNLDSKVIDNIIDSENEIKYNVIMSSLPGQCREIFHRSRFEKQTYQEIADALNLSINTIKTQMKRAISKLKTVYMKECLIEASV